MVCFSFFISDFNRQDAGECLQGSESVSHHVLAGVKSRVN